MCNVKTTRVNVDYVQNEPYPYQVNVVNGDEFEKWEMHYATLKEALRVAKDYAKYRGTGPCEVWVFDGTIYDKNGKRCVPSNR